MSDDEDEKLRSRLDKLAKVQATADKYYLESSNLISERAEVRTQKEKIERQLQFINDLLSDPSSIDRIEEYDNTFAAGNYENLREVARLLKRNRR